MNPQERILFLIDEIEKHNLHYYIKNNPIIADYDYDLLLRELQVLERTHPEFIKDNSPTQRVGTEPSAAFDSVEHKLYNAFGISNYDFESCDIHCKVSQDLILDFKKS